MAVYLKSAVWDLLLCILASAALAYTLCSGFYSTQVYQTPLGTAAVAGLCALVSVLLFAATINRRVMPFAAVGLAVVLVVAVVVAVSMSTTAEALEDAPGNYLYLALIVVLSPVAVFLLSRKKILVLVLLFVGVLLCGAIEYLYWYGHAVSFILFLVATVGLFAYRAYQKSLMDSESESLAFTSVSISGVLFGLICVGLAFAMAALVIAPMQLPNITVKLLTEHYRADEIEVKGVGDIDLLPDDQQTTDQTNNDVNKSSDEDDASGGDSSDQPEDSGMSIFGRISMMTPPWVPWALLVAFVVGVIAAILIKRARRAKRFSRMTLGANESAVEQLYLFFIERFVRFRIPAPETLTLSEYAAGFADTFSRFETGSKKETPSFSELTRVYNDVAFGGHAASDEECSGFKEYYAAFYKRAVRYVGRLRYCLLFFFI